MGKRHPLVLILAGFGYAILYIPILIMIIYSFNSSKLVTVWAGWSTKWYGELLQNGQLVDAAWISLKVGFWSATIGIVFGTMIGYALARFRRFRGKLLLNGMATAPIVMPEVVTGLSLLLLFISVERLVGPYADIIADWLRPIEFTKIAGFFGYIFGEYIAAKAYIVINTPLQATTYFFDTFGERGVGTVIISHATFAMAFVAVVIQSRLSDFDASIEEAAQDLGARQPYIFFAITLPVIMPAIIAGWLLAFTLSFDDLVIASFVSGPGASTLPIVIFSKVRLGVTPEINALATIIVAVVAIGVISANWLSLKNEASQKKINKE